SRGEAGALGGLSSGMRRVEVLMRALISATLLILLVTSVIGPAAAQQPRTGGGLTLVGPAPPPAHDPHRANTLELLPPAGPHYNTLLRTDPADKTGTKLVGDLAESWTVSRDGKTFTVKLRSGVKFHDGSELTSKDVKASYDKIISPPEGVASARKGEYIDLES